MQPILAAPSYAFFHRQIVRSARGEHVAGAGEWLPDAALPAAPARAAGSIFDERVAPENRQRVGRCGQGDRGRCDAEGAEDQRKDPLAGKKLLDELARVQPNMWPQAVQNFRSRQALHEQMLNQSKQRGTRGARGVRSGFERAAVGANRAAGGSAADSIRPGCGTGFCQSDARQHAGATDPGVDASIEAGERIVRAAPPRIYREAATAAEPIATEQQVVTASGVAVGKAEQAIYSIESAPTTPLEDKLDWQQHLKLAIDDLNHRLVDGPRSTAEVHQLVSLRIMNLLAGNTEDALKAIPNVSTEEQDYWSGQTFALATFLDHHRQPDDQRRAAASVVHLDEAVGHLRELGSLAVRNLAFCKNVYGYGAYEPIDNPVFSAGQQVTLYLEVENYHSESTSKGTPPS